MPYNGLGVFNRVYSWVQDAANGVFVDATRTDTDSDDIADGLTNCVTRDGQSPPTANLPMGGYKWTGMGNGSDNTDSITYGQVYTDTGTFAALKTFAAGYTVSGGTVTMTAASSVLVPTASLGDSSTKAASTAFVAATAFASALPAQTGSARKELKTDGITASWGFYDTYEERTSNTILAQADSRKFIDITSGTFTQTFTAAATLGDGWSVVLRNSGTGEITIPSSDGLTNWIMYPGECRQFRTNGSAFKSFVISPFLATFIATGTFIKPPGYEGFGGIAWSGGQSGQRTNNVAVLSVGGNPGGALPFAFKESELAATETVTIGSGGAAVSGVAVGNAGGNTSLGTLFTVTGATSVSGGAVSGFTGVVANVAVGFESTTAAAAPGRAVWGGGTASNDASQNGQGNIYGAGCGGCIDAAGVVRTAGTSIFGGDGGAASIASNGTDGVAPGGGGGATQTGTQSGAGARGELRIWGIV